jgi:hypothetical protein
MVGLPIRQRRRTAGIAQVTRFVHPSLLGYFRYKSSTSKRTANHFEKADKTKDYGLFFCDKIGIELRSGENLFENAKD